MQARGFSVSTIKHTHHHDIELDKPGKDSHRHRLRRRIRSHHGFRHGWARIAAPPNPPACRVCSASCGPVDVVLVEGFKQLEGLRRVEVFRGHGAPLALADPGIAAVAAPEGVQLAGYAGMRLPLDDTAAVLDFILSA